MTTQWTLASDLTADSFYNVALNLFDLYRTRIGMGEQTIKGLTFRNCRIEGPAVMLVVNGCNFDGVNFGSNGDIRSLMLKPVSPTSVIGAIPVLDCNFVGTTFFGVGFTGSETFLEKLLAVGKAQ